MAKFNAGDKVAWSHKHGAIHAEGSIIRRSAIEADGGDVQFGSVMGAANDEQTWFSVALEGGETRVLTSDELVRVAEEG